MIVPKYTNRLAHETSPYLLQHAHNPVEWHPWGAEALAKARSEDKPILLSIGYSACHWCHVMEHESFEDEEVAQVMNELFVCIKVDREERPDLDKIYQTAHQLLTQRAGGWPLNMFLTSTDHVPFFGGTYFPKTPKYGMPGFTDILEQIAAIYRNKRDAVEEQNKSLRDWFSRSPPRADAAVQIGRGLLDAAYTELKGQFDSRFGGFGRAPKFPHPTSIEFLLRYWAKSALTDKPQNDAWHMAHATLKAMASGGIYDQVGGGFCRYSVDERWMIPHFEKMLYDNAQLLPLYADAWHASGAALYRHTAIETAQWTMREMQSPEGGYYSTLDADSEGHEGKFYVWTRDEIRSLLTAAEWEVIAIRYELDGQPNFEGQFHLHAYTDSAAIAGKLNCSEADVIERLESARTKLFTARAPRIRPGRDEKILTSWNGLMIKAMARAGRVFDRADFTVSAEQALDFIQRELFKNGRLLATAKDGKAHLNAYLDDYVFMIEAGLELLQTRWRGSDLDFIRALTEVVLTHFEDRERGAFYFTADDHEPLLQRPKPTADEATPSGNGVAALVLLRLGHLLGETRYLDAAEHILRALQTDIAQHPSAHASLLMAIEEFLDPTQIVVLRGESGPLEAWRRRCGQHYAPWRLTVGIPNGAEALPGMLAARASKGPTTAYVCTGHACQAPATALRELNTVLSANELPARPTTTSPRI